MIAKCAQWIVSRQIAGGNLKEHEAGIYQYGYEMLINMVVSVLLSLIIGLLFGYVWAVAVFLLAYMPIHSNAGGLHAKTHERCTVVSMFIVLAVCLVLRFTPVDWIAEITLAGAVLSSPVIWLLCPVEDPNKPLDADEIRVYGRRSRVLLAALLAVTFILLWLGASQTAYTISLSLVTLAVMMLLGWCKNKYLSKTNRA